MEVQYGGHHEINGNMKTDKMCNQVIFRAADPGFFFSSRSFSSPLSFTRSLNDSSFFFFLSRNADGLIAITRMDGVKKTSSSGCCRWDISAQSTGHK